MTNSFSYKNFGLSIALQGSFGNKVFNSSDAQLYTRARYKQYESVKIIGYRKNSRVMEKVLVRITFQQEE